MLQVSGSSSFPIFSPGLNYSRKEFLRLVKLLSAAGHIAACMNSGHRCASWSSDMRSPVVTSLMRFSDLPF